MLQKRFPEAMAAMEDVRRMGPDSALADVGMAQVYLAEGQYDRALPLVLKQPKAAVLLALLSSIYAAAGENQKALNALQEALEKGYGDFTAIDANPYYSNLRTDPRFQRLVEKYQQRNSAQTSP